MLLFFVLMAFLVTCFGCSMLLFVSVREAVHECLQMIWLGVRQLRRTGEQALPFTVSRMLVHTGSRLRSAHAFICRHWLLALAAMVLLTVPVLLAFLLAGKAVLDGFQGGGQDRNEQVLALLQGEQLSTPVALPPLTFTTAEVVQLRPMLDSANRNWLLLEPGFSQRLLRVFRVMREQYGYEMAILEGYRSPERQNQLAQAGSNVTNARAFQSYHQFGLAADCAFLRDGKLQISEKDPWTLRGYRLYGEVAEAAGLRWGGRWAMMDFGHVEWQQAGLLRK